MKTQLTRRKFLKMNNNAAHPLAFENKNQNKQPGLNHEKNR
jgi:hypothetical protein